MPSRDELLKEIKELRRSEEKYRTLFETMAQGVVYQNAEGEIASANPGAEHILGLSLGQMQGRSSIDPRWRAIHEDGSDFPGETHPSMVALRTGREVTGVVMGVFLPREEAYRWISIHAVPQFRPGEDQPYQVYTTFDDITDRKRAEEALRESEELHRITLESISDAVFITKDDGAFTFVCPNADVIFGYSQDEATALGNIGRLLGDDLFVPDELAARGEIKNIDREVIDKAGKKRSLLVHVKQVDIRGGTTLYTCRDITERKQAEDDLQSTLLQAAQRQKELHALNGALRAVLRSSSFKGAAQSIFGYCKDLLGAAAGYVALLSEDGSRNEVLFLDAGGRKCTVDPALSMPIRGLRAEAYRSGKAVFDNGFARSEWAGFLPGGHMTLDNVLFAPLVVDGAAVGLIGLANKPGGFSEEGAQLADSFGELAAVALVNSRTLDSLHESEAMLQTSQRIGRVGSFEMDLSTGAVEWSDQVYALFGMKRDSGPLDNEEVLSLIHPDDRERAIQVSSDAAREGRAYELEHRVIHPDSRVLSLLVKGDVVRNEQNKPIKLAGTIQDVTEQRKAERALELDAAILRNVPEGIYVIGLDDGIIKRVTSRFERMFGYDPGEMVGKSVAIVNAPTTQTPQETKAQIVDVLRETGEWHGEIENIKKDGTRFWCYANVSLFDHPEFGRVMVSVHTDITDRKRAEQAIQALIKAAVGSVGKEFFDNVVTSLCGWLDADLAIIGEIVDEGRINALSMRLDGEFVERYSYTLRGTPCDEVAHKGYCVYSKGVATLFPDDEDLVQLGAQGYVGTPLRDKRGHALGVLCVISRREFNLPPQTKEVFEIIAAKAAAEMERRRAEEAQRESEGRYRTLFANMLSGFAYCKIVVDEANKPVDFVYLEVNDAFEKLTGLKREAVVGKRATEAIPGIREAHPELFDIYGHVALTGEPRSLEINFRPLDIWLWISVYRPKKGHFVAVFQNITDRKRAEEALRESEERFRTSIGNMLDCFSICSAVRDESGDIVDFRIEYVNEAACVNNRLSKEEQEGKRLLDILPAHRESGLFEEYCRLVETGEPLVKESLVYEDEFKRVRLRRAFSISAVKLGDGFAVAWRDITDRRRLENEVLEISTSEQRRIGQDLHDGLGQQLAGIAFMSKALEQKLAAKGVEEAADAEQIAKFVGEALAQTHSIARVLNPGELASGGLTSALHNLASEIESVYDIVCTFEHVAPLHVESRPVATHVFRIAQEATNNAIRHGKAKLIEIKLRVAGDNATLTVQDDGTGFAPREHQTSGMGLRIMDYRARMIGGTLNITRGSAGGTLLTCSFHNEGMVE